jgi:hypothetical protein
MTHHVIDRQQSLGNKLANFVALCDAAISEGGEIHAAMDAARGSPVDYTLIEGGTKGFGIGTGEGEDVFTLLNSIKSAMDAFASSTATWRAQLRQE